MNSKSTDRPSALSTASMLSTETNTHNGTMGHHLQGIPQVIINAEPKFSAEHSEPSRGRWVFFYTIKIAVQGKMGAQLLSRYWKISSADGDVQEVRGEGVVGEQPHILPKSPYQYESFCILPTPLGWMEGHYQMVDDEGRFFTTDIERFRLEVPGVLQ